MKSFTYSRPQSLDEAVVLLGNGATALAGGTDLLTLMKGNITSPEQLVDIKRLPQLDDRIDQTEEGISIGALVSLSQLENSPVVRQFLPALAESSSLAATPQLRNMATIGGNVLQRPRCWYFRNDDVPCWLKGGDECYARDGDNRNHAIFDVSPCIAAHPSDLASVLVAYGAIIRYQEPRASLEIGVEEFFSPPTSERRIEHVLPSNAVITGIHIPTPRPGSRSHYLKAMDRKAWAFALAGVAVSLDLDGTTITGARVVLSGVAPAPMRRQEAEQALIGQSASDEVFADAAEMAVSGAEPLEHNGYKVPLVKGLIRKALSEATA